jgi:hypothetical protein
MPRVISFDDAMKAAGGKDCSLLLGNGFSAHYFSYRSLLDKADLKADDPARMLFERLKTVDFERVVRALEGAAEVEMAYGNNTHAEQLIADAGHLLDLQPPVAGADSFDGSGKVTLAGVKFL